jgi:hypothetical protein
MNGSKMFGPQDLQARKQMWWACSRADIYTAVYMGRPPSISERDFDTPLPEVISHQIVFVSLILYRGGYRLKWMNYGRHTVQTLLGLNTNPFPTI